jgi:hypothetical protein
MLRESQIGRLLLHPLIEVIRRPIVGPDHVFPEDRAQPQLRLGVGGHRERDEKQRSDGERPNVRGRDHFDRALLSPPLAASE